MAFSLQYSFFLSRGIGCIVRIASASMQVILIRCQIYEHDIHIVQTEKKMITR